ncbi:uncharacterized protein LOC113564538 [Drosophila erecta]|uniref:uncharacterized protein LOC113564538 n=1 Tax=Drosophila erecta TaxID=7220 RepID=UPI000F052B6B|nr:uncharacterized protein LOC113564538 [Drosophila erecta]
MGIFGTLHMVHKVYSTQWRRETSDTPDSKVCGCFSKSHRRHECQFLAFDSDSEDSESNSGRGDFDDRTKKFVKRNLKSLVSIGHSKELCHLVRFWWPLNVCNEMGQRIRQIVTRRKSKYSVPQNPAHFKDNLDMLRFSV